MSKHDGDNKGTSACRICDGPAFACFTAKEMMFGRREDFAYLECRSCGCVQISEYPENIADHYPPGYYSYESSTVPDPKASTGVLKGISKFSKRTLMRKSGYLRRRFLGSASTQNWLRSRPVVNSYMNHVPSPDKKILDVGCGGGGLLKSLAALYYRNLHGIDPFISDDVYLDGRLLVKRANMGDLRPDYDCISFHHVLEHMPDQAAALQAAHALLAPDGLVMIRIPVVGGAAWRTYRENWVQLDPPRHYYLHSESSFGILSAQAGFDVCSIEYDSTGFQFWGSELYLRGIPLMGTGQPEDSKDAIFSHEELAEFEAQSKVLNQSRDGDQIMAILRKKTPASSPIPTLASLRSGESAHQPMARG